MSTSQLHHEIVPQTALDDARRAEMLALMQQCYDCVTRERFDADLVQKDFIVLLLDAAGRMRGFSTQQIFTHASPQGPVRVLFSGDTVISPEYWGSHELAHGWCAVAAHALQLTPPLPLYWMLISKGYRTYLYLPLFFRDYHPSLNGTSSLALWRGIAQQYFGNSFDAESGVVRFNEPCGQLKPALAGVPAGRLDDPHVQYFLQRNPGYAQGDELVCLAEISLANTHGIGHRWLRRALEAAA